MASVRHESVGTRPRARNAVLAAVVIVACLGVVAILPWTALSHYQVGRVEAISGTMAAISVPGLGADVTAEVVDGNLTAGAEVVVCMGDGYVSLVATSPGSVRLIKVIRELL